MTAFGLMLSGAGLVLLYASLKNEDPRTIVADVLSGKRKLARPASAPAGADGSSRNDAGINNGTSGAIPAPVAPGSALGAIAGQYAGYGSPSATTAYSPLSPASPAALD